MGKVVSLIKWLLVLIGAVTVYVVVLFWLNTQTKALDVYWNMGKTLVDTGDMAMSTIVRTPVPDDVSNEDVEEAMSSIATELQIREVGKLPLSEQVELQTSEKQRFLKIFQYCSPRTAMKMVDYSDAFAAYLPCRIALLEDKQGKRWLYSLNMDMMIYGGKPLPDDLYELAVQVKDTITQIQEKGAIADF